MTWRYRSESKVSMHDTYHTSDRLCLIWNSTTKCKLFDLIPAVWQSDCPLDGSMLKSCIVPTPTTVKLPHASSHSSGNCQGHVTKTKMHYFVLVVHGLLIVKSHTNCDVTTVLLSCSVTKMLMGLNSGKRHYKCNFPLLFKHSVHGRIGIDHSHTLWCLGWPCNPAQDLLCRIAVPTTPAQTISWSIPIIIHSDL